MKIDKMLLGFRLMRRTNFSDPTIFRFNTEGYIEGYTTGNVNVLMTESDKEKIQKYAEKDGISLQEETSKILHEFFQSRISDFLFPILFLVMRKDKKNLNETKRQ